MAVSIRLRRMGRKGQPHYRIVVADSEHPRDGRFVESLGFYKPLSDPARLVLDLERVEYWLGHGARPSGTVKSLIGKARRGGDKAVAVGEVDPAAAKAKRAELLAERRAAEKRAGAEAEAAEQAAADEAAAAAAAEAVEADGEGDEATEEEADVGEEPEAAATETVDPEAVTEVEEPSADVEAVNEQQADAEVEPAIDQAASEVGVDEEAEPEPDKDA